MSGFSKDKDGMTERQAAYVREYVRLGGAGEKAAKAAGYGAAGARQRSSENLQNPVIQEAIRKETNKQMGEHAPMCVRVLAELAERAESETVRASSAQTLLDRSGYKLPDKLEVTDGRTAQDVERDLHTLLGISDADTQASEGEKLGEDGGNSAPVTH